MSRHRGDRVVQITSGQRGVVEGWKGMLVLVYWGTHDNRQYRDWVHGDDLMHVDAYDLLEQR